MAAHKQTITHAAFAVLAVLHPITPAPEPAQLIRRLFVHVVEARDLPKVDIGTTGIADPYVKLSSNGVGFETRVIWNTSIPLWDEHFDFRVDSENQVVRYELWDRDKGSADDFMGCFSMTVADVKKRGAAGLDEWFELQEDKRFTNVVEGGLAFKIRGAVRIKARLVDVDDSVPLDAAKMPLAHLIVGTVEMVTLQMLQSVFQSELETLVATSSAHVWYPAEATLAVLLATASLSIILDCIAVVHKVMQRQEKEYVDSVQVYKFSKVRQAAQKQRSTASITPLHVLKQSRYLDRKQREVIDRARAKARQSVFYIVERLDAVGTVLGPAAAIADLLAAAAAQRAADVAAGRSNKKAGSWGSIWSTGDSFRTPEQKVADAAAAAAAAKTDPARQAAWARELLGEMERFANRYRTDAERVQVVTELRAGVEEEDPMN